jgi:predicted transcriptional regulator
MDDITIPEDLRRFVLTSVPSVPFLEALLLLRADPARHWQKDMLAQRLYIRDRVAQALLDDLCTAGMAARRDASSSGGYYCYQPSSDAVRDRIDQLADLYSKHLVEVTLLIHSSLDRKAQQFADAFKWRKDS